MEVGPSDTAIHPAIRRGVMEVRVRNKRGIKRLKGLLDGHLWSVSYNVRGVNEENVENVCWGENDPRLEAIKTRYDPDHRLNVYHGVSYRREKDNDNVACPRQKNIVLITATMFYVNFAILTIGSTLSDILNLIVASSAF